VQAVLNGRQRDIHDRRVQHDHELRDADDHEDEPAVGLSSVGHLTAWRYNDLRFRVIRGL
jgi:hypothetical protein